jgi:hypothetical protein
MNLLSFVINVLAQADEEKNCKCKECSIAALHPFEKAKNVVERRRTQEGFLASADLYKDLWLRDLFYSESALIKLGYNETVRRHFETILKYQLKSGEIPTVTLGGWKRLLAESFHYWTIDSQILFVLGMTSYAKMTKDYAFLDRNKMAIERCVKFIKGRSANGFGLVPGLDWRDAIVNYYHGTKYLLSNQVLLAQMYEELGRTEDAKTLCKLFFSRSSGSGPLVPVDCIYWEDDHRRRKEDLKFEYRLDSLGNSLAILFEVVSGSDAVEVARNLDRARTTKNGYRNLTPPMNIERTQAFASRKAMNAFVKSGAFLRNRPNHYQNSAVWPFIESRIVSAFRKVGLQQKAEELSKIMVSREGFNEWYSPIDGRPHGSRDQLWTAAAVLEQQQSS